MNDEHRLRRIETARVSCLFSAPFFAGAICRLPVRLTDSVETAATDGDTIEWSRSWLDSLPDAVLPTVLVHESSHCLFGHLWRAPEGADWDRWNQACDHEVNLGLIEWSEKSKQLGRRESVSFPRTEGRVLRGTQNSWDWPVS